MTPRTALILLACVSVQAVIVAKALSRGGYGDIALVSVAILVLHVASVAVMSMEAWRMSASREAVAGGFVVALAVEVGLFVLFRIGPSTPVGVALAVPYGGAAMGVGRWLLGVRWREAAAVGVAAVVFLWAPAVAAVLLLREEF